MHPAVDRELALLTPSVRRCRVALEAIFHADFREVGASGHQWTREEMILAITSAADDDPIEVVDLNVVDLAPEVAHVTFVSDPGGRAAARSSLWLLEAGRWQLYYHHGTLLPSAKHAIR